MKIIRWTLTGLTCMLIIACSDVPTPGILKNLIYEDENTTCYDDGFDILCITAVDGKDGIDGIDGESIVGPPGKDGSDGRDGESITGLPGRDGTTTVIHQTEFRYVDIPHPEPVPESTPAPTPKRVIVEAVVHPTESIHPIPAQITHTADHIVHVSHLTEVTHTEIPPHHAIWHVAIQTLDDNHIAIYVYPRSLNPNDRSEQISLVKQNFKVHAPV